MSLSGLLSSIEDMPEYKRLIQDLKLNISENNVVVPDSVRHYFIACLYYNLGRPILVVTAKADRARQLYEQIQSWFDSNVPIMLFPEPDAIPYEDLTSDSYTVQRRLRVLSGLGKVGKPALVVASAYAAVQKTIPFTSFEPSCQILRKGSRINLDRSLATWMDLGYEMENMVQIPGTISRRGGIIDIYPINSDPPARIELYGDEVDSIRLFDPITQRSTELIDDLAIIPAREVILPISKRDEMLNRLDISPLNEVTEKEGVVELEGLVKTRWLNGLDFYAPMVNSGSFFDYLPEHTLLVLDQPDDVEATVTDLDVRAAELYSARIRRGELSANLPKPYFSYSEVLTRIARFNCRLALDRLAHSEQYISMGFSSAPSYNGRLSVFFKEAKPMMNGGRRIVIISQQTERLAEILGENGIIASPTKDIIQLPPVGSLTLVKGALAEGWMTTKTGGDVVLSDLEIFGYAKKERLGTKRSVRRDTFLDELSLGDFVVHVDHGIGRFSGLTKLCIDNGEREYLLLEYAAGDKLYVPSEQVERVSRYIGSGGYTPSLSRLGTHEWNRAKQRVREATANLAKELLSVYSSREILNGFAFSPDTVWQQELESSFPYVETLDQYKTMEQVKEDMESQRPMDRLICGDVGYGKTEVAIRAAFKAIMDGMQVAILVPTTVLAQQHLTTFSDRLSAFPVQVGLLSRFRSPKEQQEIIKGLAAGVYDICIGTHRILQKDVFFKKLGLVIVDEEQRFGVAHKERLKQLRREVDVLTLGATPIPRTLYMSLIGIRDMSTMETPPEDRLPIKTYVAHYDERLVREAILRELERNGQVFYVHNRVQRINSVARKLEVLVPESRIGFAHGQMPEDMLESVMIEFVERRIDVLVCTTIIESGLDMPNVNTLIVDDADRLGLTQLYQLRGRIGRGVNRAYAYFLYSKGKQLTDAAHKRLRTIFEATELGSGFRIAMKDLEIRGAGNLLGPEQSGHMGAVGFELYCRLLSDAVAELKSDLPEHAALNVAPTVDLPLHAYIPESYIADLSTRLSMYMKISKIDSLEGIEIIKLEFQDRFGPILPQVENLLYMVRLKILAQGLHIKEISSERGKVVIKMQKSITLDGLMLPGCYDEKVRVGTNHLTLNIRRIGEGWEKMLEDTIERIGQTIDG